jgi:hypothetical protein
MRVETWLALASVVGGGCLRTVTFHCLFDSECGPSGTCELVTYCSFPDSACTSGQRFGHLSGELADQCVDFSLADPAVDAGIDARPDALALCPSSYAAIAGSIHRYRVLFNLSWDEAKVSCMADGQASGQTYLAVPDDATEFAALATATAPPFWIGIDDLSVENMFVTVRGAPATFLPWAAGQPDHSAPPRNCVDTISTTQIATDVCSARHAAICECEL